MRIKISKEASLKEFYLNMEIKRASDKKDLVAYAKLAEENGDSLNPEIICHSFLHDIKPKVGEEILKECSKKGLFVWDIESKTAKITSLGKEIAKTGVPYTYEHDLYYLVYLNEPLILNSLIGCHFVKNLQNNLAEKKEQVSNNLIKNLIGKKFSPYTRKNYNGSEPEKVWIKDNIEICKINPEPRIEFDSGIKLKIEFETSDNTNNVSIQILGEYNDTFPQNCNDKKYFNEIFHELVLSPEFKEWNFEKKALGIKYSEGLINFIKIDDENKILTFSLELEKEFESEILGSGKFNIEIDDIPIFPLEYEDTLNLYYKLLESEILDYISKEEYSQKAENLKKKLITYCKLDYDFEIPERITFARKIQENDNGERLKTYWNIMAPFDLNLEEV